MASSVYGLNFGKIPEEQMRLEWQHWNIFLPIHNGLLLPSQISTYLQSVQRLAVADVGTGTGVWLATLAPQLTPDARLDGFDFNTSKFRKPELLPPNVQLKYADALKPFPPELHGQYDLVHVRAFVFALRDDDDWKSMIVNLKTLLKPGGWLLCVECPMSSWSTVPLGDAWSKVIRIIVKSAMSNGVNPSAPCRLLEYMENAGLVERQEVIRNSLSRTVTREAVSLFAVNAFRQYLLGLLAKGGMQGLETQVDADALIAALEKELNEDCEVNVNISQTWARKPEMSGV